MRLNNWTNNTEDDAKGEHISTLEVRSESMFSDNK